MIVSPPPSGPVSLRRPPEPPRGPREDRAQPPATVLARGGDDDEAPTDDEPPVTPVTPEPVCLEDVADDPDNFDPCQPDRLRMPNPYSSPDGDEDPVVFDAKYCLPDPLLSPNPYAPEAATDPVPDDPGPRGRVMAVQSGRSDRRAPLTSILVKPDTPGVGSAVPQVKFLERPTDQKYLPPGGAPGRKWVWSQPGLSARVLATLRDEDFDECDSACPGNCPSPSKNGTPAAELPVNVACLDMPKEQFVEILTVCRGVLKELDVEVDIAKEIKKTLDKMFGPVWMVVVGDNFGVYVTYQQCRFAHFYLGDLSIVVFKSMTMK